MVKTNSIQIPQSILNLALIIAMVHIVSTWSANVNTVN